jgi:hypothetical protein
VVIQVVALAATLADQVIQVQELAVTQEATAQTAQAVSQVLAVSLVTLAEADILVVVYRATLEAAQAALAALAEYRVIAVQARQVSL